MNFNFGNSSNTSQPNAFGGFGTTNQPATATSTGFFGANNTGGFGTFGQPAASTANANPFQPATASLAPAAVTTSASTFGTGNAFGTGSFGTGLSSFGTNQATAQPSVSTGFSFNTGNANTFNAPVSSMGLGGNSFSTGLFGAKPATSTGNTFSFNQPAKPVGVIGQAGTVAPAPTPAPREVDPNTFLPKMFNDERDRILGEFNKLQAAWGTGKGFFAPNVLPVPFSQHQTTHKFKAVGFSEIKGPAEDETEKIDVLVKFAGAPEQLAAIIPTYEGNLKNLFGANFNVKVESSKPLPDQKVYLSISVVDINTNKRLPTFQLVSYYEQPQIKPQFHNAFGGNLLELIKPLSKAEIEQYLKEPPFGLDPRLWEQAKKENPDPKKFIPVAFAGFEALNARFKFQVQETDQQKLRLSIIAEEIANLQRDVSAARAKVEECKRRNVALGNRVLKTMVWQEIKRKKGYPILPEEDELRAKLQSLQAELNAPTKYKGCLNELICKLRHMQSQRQATPKFALEEGLMKEIEGHLIKEQQGIEYLLDLVKNDLKDLKSIKSNLVEN